MITVELTTSRRRWSLLWRRRFVLDLPERWAEVPSGLQRKWWVRALSLRPFEAAGQCLRDLIPARWLRNMSNDDLATVQMLLLWLAPNMERIAVPEFQFKNIHFVLGAESGKNITCAEFYLADNLYTKYAMHGHADTLNLLTWLLYRERDSNEFEGARRGDMRVPVSSMEQVEYWAKLYGTAPADIQAQALIYFEGVKSLIHRQYGSWIFQDDPAAAPSTGPNFGWIGVFQGVAEGGAFGTLEQVYQSSIHEVCIYLVRKRQEQIDHEKRMEEINQKNV